MSGARATTAMPAAKTVLATRATKATRTVAVLGAVFICSLGLSGCWDMFDIEQRAFVDAVGVDVAQSPPKTDGGGGTDRGGRTLEKVEPEDVGLGKTQKRIVITVEIPIISQLAGGGGGSGDGGGAGKKPAWVLSASGSTLFEANRELATMSNRRLFYGHLKTIVISEEAAKAGVQPLLDFFERGREPLQPTKLAVALGRADKALQISPKLEKLAGTYLNTLLQQDTRTSRMLQTDLGQFLSEIHSRHNSVLPRLKPGKDQAKAAGTAVFKHFKLVGWLGEIETRGLTFLLNRVRGGVIMVTEDTGGRTKGTGITGFEIGNAKTKITPRIVDGKPVFRVTVQAEGVIAERTSIKPVFSTKTVRAVERKVSAEIKRNMQGTLDKLQKEFKVDVICFGDLLHKNFPRQWAKWKNTWDDEQFPEARVDISVVTHVRRVGTTQ